jgi:5-(carboxyamino)imidazole ribonucleotide synthase
MAKTNNLTIGIIGGGQLGRMLAMAAARLNHRTIVLEPQADCPAAQVCNDQIVAEYDDEKALAELASRCDVVTYEFENVPVAAAEKLSASVPVYPPAQALSASQDRLTEKRFLNGCGIPTADFRAVDSQDELEAALTAFGGKGVLKTRRMGYDGKGQRVFRGGEDLTGSFAALGGVPLILESFVAFEREVSIIAARFQDGTVTCYDPAENVHLNGILHTSTVPQGLSPCNRPKSFSPRSSMSASSVSNFSFCRMVLWLPMKWRRVSTIPATGRKRLVRSRSSSSISGPCRTLPLAARIAIPIV